jgi:hypothetical protein
MTAAASRAHVDLLVVIHCGGRQATAISSTRISSPPTTCS